MAQPILFALQKPWNRSGFAPLSTPPTLGSGVILPNGNASSNSTPPTLGSGVSISGGAFNCSSAGAIVSWSNVLTIGKSYKVTLDYVCTGGQKLRVNNNATDGTNIKDIQPVTVDGASHPLTFLIFVADSTDLSIGADSVLFSGSIDNVVAVEIGADGAILPNGDFTRVKPASQSFGTGCTQSPGKLSCSAASSIVTWTGALTIGQQYSVTVTYSCDSGSNLRASNNATDGTNVVDIKSLVVDSATHTLTFATFTATSVDFTIGADTATYSGRILGVVATNVSTGTTYNDTLSESATAADALDPAGSTFAVPLPESLTSADAASIAATFPNALSEGLTSADGASAALITSPGLSEALTSAFSPTSQAILAQSLAEGLTAADSEGSAATWQNVLTAAVTATDGETSTAIFPNALTEGGTVAAAFSSGPTTYNDSLTESLTAAMSLGVGVVIGSAMSEAAALADSVAAALTVGASVNEGVAANDNAAATSAYPATLTEILTAGDALESSVGILHPDVTTPADRSVTGARQPRMVIGSAGKSRRAIGNLQRRQVAG
jgi:hypothetical protein